MPESRACPGDGHPSLMVYSYQDNSFLVCMGSVCAGHKLQVNMTEQLCLPSVLYGIPGGASVSPPGCGGLNENARRGSRTGMLGPNLTELFGKD